MFLFLSSIIIRIPELRWLSLFLVPATTRHTDKHLSSALGGVMDVPVVAATRFEGDIGNGNLLVGNLCKITCDNIWNFKRFLLNAKYPFPARNNLDFAVFVLYDLLLIIGEYYPSLAGEGFRQFLERTDFSFPSVDVPRN